MTTTLTAHPENASVGAGMLFLAPLGSAVPADLTTAWDAAWLPIGMTEDGHTFTAGITTQAMFAAEILDPYKIATTGRTGTVAFNALEDTATNLKRAFNGGTITTGTNIVTYRPPAVGQEVRQMIGWESDDHTERAVWYQCLQTGNVTIQRRKAPNATAITMSFSLELPAGQTYPWEVIYGTSVTLGATSRG